MAAATSKNALNSEPFPTLFRQLNLNIFSFLDERALAITDSVSHTFLAFKQEIDNDLAWEIETKSRFGKTISEKTKSSLHSWTQVYAFLEQAELQSFHIRLASTSQVAARTFGHAKPSTNIYYTTTENNPFFRLPTEALRNPLNLNPFAMWIANQSEKSDSTARSIYEDSDNDSIYDTADRLSSDTEESGFSAVSNNTPADQNEAKPAPPVSIRFLDSPSEDDDIYS